MANTVMAMSIPSVMAKKDFMARGPVIYGAQHTEAFGTQEQSNSSRIAAGASDLHFRLPIIGF